MNTTANSSYLSRNFSGSDEECFFLPDAEFEKIYLRYKSNLITAIINAVFAPVAVAANLVVAFVIFRSPHLRRPSTFLLGCLAICDLLVGLLEQPSYVAFRLLENHINYVPCSIRMLYSTGFYICYGVSFMTLSAISCERFVALALHLRYQELVTTRRVFRIVILIWSTDIVLTALQWAGINTVIRAIHLVLWCTCLVSSGFIHYRIARIVRRHQKLIKMQQQTTSSRYKRQTKLAMNIAYIVGIYFFFNIPVLFVTIYHQIASGSLSTYDFYSWTETIAFCNSAINPFVCIWRSREIRKAVGVFLKKGFCSDDLRLEDHDSTSVNKGKGTGIAVKYNCDKKKNEETPNVQCRDNPVCIAESTERI
ncbi:melanocyte-stimulating hormone receptor-like [Actinia tenebrosa]|uniref:Melanocyte-stimulating hormone receptor-like n=1 Tax=Actinia tenebrosa TaxID=6105 RepID=A0A6P8IZV1_ACTTE|nr:melanocyte-stimulating hormone receptor-like [Actinia tenebrosa]